MKIGYARVSTIDQNIEAQIKLLEESGCSKIYSEKRSGKNIERIELKKMLMELKKGDELIVTSFSRLARSTKNLLDITEDLEKRGVSFRSIKEVIDTKGASGKLMLTILGAIATFERELMLEKQKDGIALAKEQGKYKGKARTNFLNEKLENCFSRRLNKELTGEEAFRISGLTKGTYYKLFQEYKKKKEEEFYKKHRITDKPLF